MRRCLPQESKRSIDHRRCAVGDSSALETLAFQDASMSANFQQLANFIWSVADLLRGPYRPPQYERVMLPLTCGTSR